MACRFEACRGHQHVESADGGIGRRTWLKPRRMETFVQDRSLLGAPHLAMLAKSADAAGLNPAAPHGRPGSSPGHRTNHDSVTSPSW